MILENQYIIALTNLYGIVHKDKVIEIYNSQNKEKITKKLLEDILYDTVEEIKRHHVYPYKDYFVKEVIIEFDEFDALLEKKGNKPYYVPEKKELLKYVDEFYFEKTNEYDELLEYVNKNFFPNNKDRAEDICEDIQTMCMYNADIKAILQSFKSRGISFKDMVQANEVLKLINELINNVRNWENNGYTPLEMSEILENPKLRPLPDGPYIYEKYGVNVKVGRNEPCPCGSEKKYKKCCLNKD